METARAHDKPEAPRQLPLNCLLGGGEKARGVSASGQLAEHSD